ncbi:MAG: hypothetical protein IKV09_03890 [Alistipes sp.]|nr:hypothetical protein [Alistipes sp.]
MTLLSSSILLLVALPFALLATQQILLFRNHRTERQKARCVGEIMLLLKPSRNINDDDITTLSDHFSESTLREAILFISDNIYGQEAFRLASIIEICGVDYRILHLVHRFCDTSCTAQLATLSHLPLTPALFELAEDFIDRERQPSFYATVALVATQPERAICYISYLRHNLSIYEVARLAEIMRRRGSTIAYTPLLNSENYNLQLLGVYIAASFSATDAEPALQKMLVHSDKRLALYALYALCSLRGNISSEGVQQLFNTLKPYHRKAFIRHVVQACYSSLACSPLLNEEEYTSLCNRINSYKCRMICN